MRGQGDLVMRAVVPIENPYNTRKETLKKINKFNNNSLVKDY